MPPKNHGGDCALYKEPAVRDLTGTQDPFGINRFAAMDTGLSEDEVVIHPQRMGGVCGRSIMKSNVRRRLARAKGSKRQWTRADEFTAGRNRPRRHIVCDSSRR